MIINRNNYEEFFLLYVDNELNKAQRLEVENFAQQNPDLAEELEMLKQSTLVAEEDVVFNQKELLFKKEAGINSSNYEEYFLLSIDNELTKEEQSEVEKFVLKHPELQEEFTLLKQTKLEPEVIEFTAKDTLYRTEKKERRVIPIKWVRMNAAAAVVLLAVSMWLFNTNRHGINRELASHAKQSVTKPLTSPNTNVTVTKGVDASLTLKKEQPEEADGQVATAKTIHKQFPKSSPTNVEFQRTEEVNDEKYVKDQNLAQVEVARPIDEKLSSAALVAVNNATKSPNVLSNNLFGAADKQNIAVEKPIVQDAVYHELDNEDDNTLYIGGAQINKNKLKALFKKATNLLDKKVGRNESEKTVQIASFEIKSK